MNKPDINQRDTSLPSDNPKVESKKGEASPKSDKSSNKSSDNSGDNSVNTSDAKFEVARDGTLILKNPEKKKGFSANNYPGNG